MAATMITAAQIEAGLGGKGGMAPCPCHDDSTASLSIKDGEKGPVVYCHGGCTQADVISALRERGLWLEKGDTTPLPGRRSSPVAKIWTPVFPIPTGTPAPPDRHPQHGPPSQRYDYRDASGNLLMIIYRFELPSGKVFAPLTWCTDGTRHSWRWQALPAPRPLFGLELLPAMVACPVVLVEGEKAAEAGRRLAGDRYLFMAWPGGAGAIGKIDFSLLRGRDCILWPDNDQPGEKAMDAVAAALVQVGAASVRRVDPPAGAAKGGDVADAEAEGWTAEQLAEYLAAARVVSGGPAVPVAEDAEPDFEETIKRLVPLSLLELDRCLDAEAAILGVRKKTLEAVVAARRKESAAAGGLPEDEPWPEPVALSEVLSTVCALLHRFTILDKSTVVAVALWISMTWFVAALSIVPLLPILAPEKRCGKSTLLSVIMRLCRKPLPASNITPAAMFRTVELWRPTLLLDEVDAFLRDNEDLRGLLNAGHSRETSFVIRLVGDAHEPKRFDVFGPKVLAGIGKLPGTIADRSIIVNMRRKLPHEHVDRLRHAPPELFERPRRQFRRCAEDHMETVRAARPDIPEALNDRAADNWSSLLALADLAGGEWPELARRAALILSGDDDTEASTGQELLADIREIFGTKQTDRLTSAELVAALIDDTEAGWATYNRGRAITPRQIAKRLSEYHIAPHSIRVLGSVVRGYNRDDFAEAWRRYLPAVAEPADEWSQAIIDLSGDDLEWRREMLADRKTMNL